MEVRWGDDVLRFEIEAHGGATELKRSCGVPYTHCPLCDPIT